jgi:hypothetical protein
MCFPADQWKAHEGNTISFEDLVGFYRTPHFRQRRLQKKLGLRRVKNALIEIVLHGLVRGSTLHEETVG